MSSSMEGLNKGYSDFQEDFLYDNLVKIGDAEYLTVGKDNSLQKQSFLGHIFERFISIFTGNNPDEKIKEACKALTARITSSNWVSSDVDKKATAVFKIAGFSRKKDADPNVYALYETQLKKSKNAFEKLTKQALSEGFEIKKEKSIEKQSQDTKK